MMKRHRLLKRQLKKSNLTEAQLAQLEPLLNDINDAYRDFDNDINYLETIIEKSSKELFDINKKLQSNVVSITSKLNRIVENVHEIIFETDIQGNWTYLNPAWETFTGLTVEESIGKNFTEFFVNESFQTIFGDVEFLQLEDKIYNHVFEYTNHKGENRWGEGIIKVLKNDEGRYEGCIGSLVDITRLKKVQTELVKSRDQEAYANRAKNEFLSTMSHEIRTPLNAVIGISHLLLIEDPKEEQLENLNSLKYSSEHLLGLVNDILDFNKIDSGVLELENSDFSITHILNGLQSTFLQQAEEKQIRFIIKKDDTLPDIIVGDSLRLSQVLTNLVNNAIKFTEKGKVILDIEVLRNEEKKIVVQFEIIDTGIGIEKNKLEKIFEPFTQANSNTSRKYGGTGLGLAICKKLLKLMGSSLIAISKKGEGSTFSFTLAFDKSDKFSTSKLQYMNIIPSFSSLKKLKALVVEDHKMNIMVIRKFFRKWEIDFEIAENGLIAVEMAEANNYDVILMDLQMPVMDGYEASQKIRESKKKHNHTVPIYALSASAAMNVKNKIIAYGMDGHISKPFNPSDLYQVLKKHLKS